MEYDLAIIGAGWAGFNAALTAKASGLKVILIEKDEIGGTCLNRGCIPTKALIQAAKIYSLTKKAQIFGVETQNSRINFAQASARKEKVVQQLRQGMEFMLRGLEVLKGRAELLSSDTLRAGQKEISAKSVLIACGSRPIELGNLRFDGKKIISSDDLLSLKDVPRSLLIIGGGVIGCEFASLFNALGTQVSIVELAGQLLPGEDNEISKKLENSFRKRGIKISVNTDATTVSTDNYDLVLLSIGRQPDTKGLGLDTLGLKLEKERIIVDDYLRTNILNIYAAGDCTGKIMLAHYASFQGRIAAHNIAQPDNPRKADNKNIPNCIFSDPQIASIGLNEEYARDQGFDVSIRKFDFLGSGMARIIEEADGFIKIVSDSKNDQILGASIIGPQATELIGILTVALSLGLKASSLKKVIFAHPTLSESVTEAL